MSHRDDEDYGLEEAMPGSEPERKPCPQCGRLRSADVDICAHCGFDHRRGLESATRLSGIVRDQNGPRCAACGYPVRGLNRPRCPECGQVFTPQSSRSRAMESGDDVTRWEYLKPVLMFFIGIGVVTPLVYFTEGGGEALAYIASFGILVPIGVGAFFLCCLLWIGFDAPLHLTALRLAGIYAVVDLVAVLVGMIPVLGAFAWLVAIATYVGLLSEMLELELLDAVAVAVLTFFVRVAIVLTMMGWFGIG